MANNGLQSRERAYRSASRTYDYFVTGLSSLLLLATALTFEVAPRPLWNVLESTAILMFMLAVIAGLKKLEYYVAILGADFSIALTETNQRDLTIRESTAVLRDLNEAVENLSSRASVVHRLRNWFLVLGLALMIASRLLPVTQTF